MPTAWDEFERAERRAEPGTEFPESGWGALLCWIAGPENVRRFDAVGEAGTTLVTVESVDATDAFARPTTAAERESIDESIDEYLQEADVPPRPRGFHWCARPGTPGPDAWSRALQDAVEANARPSDPRVIRELGEQMTRPARASRRGSTGDEHPLQESNLRPPRS